MSTTAIQPKSHVGTQVEVLSKREAAQLGSQGIVLRTVDDMMSFAKAALASKMVPPGLDTQEKAFMALQMGLEWGLTPFQSLAGIAIIKGKPCIFGEHILAVCMKSPAFDHGRFRQGWIGKVGDKEFAAWCECARIGAPVVRQEFSWDDALRAKLPENNAQYNLHPATMLQRRATMRALKRAFADVLSGVPVGEPGVRGVMVEMEGIESPRTPFDPPASTVAAALPATADADPFDAPVDALAGVTDEAIVAALDGFVATVAKEEGSKPVEVCERFLSFTYGDKTGFAPEPKWFVEKAGRDAEKHAVRVRIMRSIAAGLLADKDPRFVIEKAAA